MADNTILDAGAGGDTIATDDIAGVKHQRVKIEYGADGSATDVSDANPLPVDDAGGSLTVDDGGGSLTVDGTVAVSSLPALGAGTANIGDVDVLTVPAPLSTTGGGTEAAAQRVTIANDSTGVLSVDDNGASLTVDGSVTLGANSGVDVGDVTINNAAGGAAVNIQDGGNSITIDGTVAVSSLPALAAGSANIGDVDVLSVVPGTGATALGKAIDSAAGATDTVVGAGALRDDVLATLTPADGDYTHLRTNARGALWAQLDAPPTGSGILVARNIDVDETEDAIKASAGTLWGYFFANLASSVRFVKLYDATVASVTVGSTTPFLTLPIPAGAAGHIDLARGIPFATAITVAATTGIGDADAGAPGANEVVFNAYYT